MSNFTIEFREDGPTPEFYIYEWGTYDRNSVLAGQVKKSFRDCFDTLEEAQAAFPKADYDGYIRDAHNTFNHLPGEDDPVPGGMYPDDISDHPFSGRGSSAGDY